VEEFRVGVNMCFKKVEEKQNSKIEETKSLLDDIKKSMAEMPSNMEAMMKIGLRPWREELDYSVHRYSEAERIMRVMARALYGQIAKENAISTFEAREESLAKEWKEHQEQIEKTKKECLEQLENSRKI